MTIDPAILSSLIVVLVSLGGAFLIAFWAALIIWTYRDARLRVREPGVHILASLLVAVLHLPGLLLYLILRPARTLEEEYQHALEEEVLLQTLEEPLTCPGCERRVREDWLVCPTCQTRLRKPCHACGRLMELSWTICPYCATPVPGLRKEVNTVEEALQDILPPTSQPTVEAPAVDAVAQTEEETAA